MKRRPGAAAKRVKSGRDARLERGAKAGQSARLGQGAGLERDVKAERSAGVKRRATTEQSTELGRIAKLERDVKAEQNIPVVKNGEYTAEIVGLGHEGEGVGRVEGFTLFIHGALPDEKVRVKVLKLKKQYGYAKLLEVLERSEERTAAPCPVYDRCGGCQLQHLDYRAQLRHKRQTVIDCLQRIGGLAIREDQVHPTLGMDDPWRYRNKAQMPIGEREGGLVGGFYARGSHRIVEVDHCLIQHADNDAATRFVKRVALELGIPAFNELTGQGLLRHVMVRNGVHSGEIMVVLVTNGKRIPHEEEWVARIREGLPGVTSICQNINRERTNVIFGEKTRVLWGKPAIHDTIGGIRFAISPRSFYQINPLQTERLYGKALAYAALTGEEIVIDAYCGIGTISLFLARRAQRVYGVEAVAEAVEDARRNAELNGIANVEFVLGLAEEIIPAWKARGVAADVIVVDPPRKGCDPALLDAMIAMRPARIVYVSCNPATLARDLRLLGDGGYRVAEVQPVDMFPHTVHVESVCSLIYKGAE